MARTPEQERPNKGENQPESAKRTRAKKTYVSPRLLEYGSVTKLTQSGAATLGDGFGMMSCL